MRESEREGRRRLALWGALIIVALFVLGLAVEARADRLVIYGDSLASSCSASHCWSPLPDNRWPAMAGIDSNRARPGTEVYDWAANLDIWMSDPAWDYGDRALILLGTNSAWDHTWPGVDISRYLADLHAIAGHLHYERGFQEVRFLRPPAPALPFWGPLESSEAADRLAILWALDLEVCAELSWVRCDESLALPPTGLREMGLHWNDAGHEWAAARVVPEPSTVLLLGLGCLALWMFARRRSRPSSLPRPVRTKTPIPSVEEN